MKAILSIKSNNDYALIAWNYNEYIPNCIGFALYRKINGQEELLENQIGFADDLENNKPYKYPSNKYPIQRFVWTDFKVYNGAKINYRIVPIVLENNIVKEHSAKEIPYLKEDVIIGTGEIFKSYFNVGLVSSQFYSKWKNNLGSNLRPVDIVHSDQSNKLRNFLGGELSKNLFQLLDDVIIDKSKEVFLALFELDQEDLIEKLIKIGDRCHLILANGAANNKKIDKNSQTRQRLSTTQIELFDRIVGSGHLSHNKFMVVCNNSNGNITPEEVFTGSLNWTPNGLFGQVNNGILIKDNKLAKEYHNEWLELKSAKSDYTKKLYDYNSSVKKGTLPLKTNTWFNPLKDEKDLQSVRDLLDNAKEGILFLMFNPGTKNTLYNKILEISKQKPDIYIRGILNQEPVTKGDKLVDLKHPIKIFDKGKTYKTDWETILPSAIKEQDGWEDESTIGLVRIHSKVIVIDPFGKNPFVITGSNNMGPKASKGNDDNLNIISDKKLAEEYAVNILANYNHYHFRFSSKVNKNYKYKGLTKDLKWMKTYLNEYRKRELDFWTK
ncbi:phospholipase D-like domain-containing protein [Confluentibacter sediminis]|uniref:phospholipase D-like domain-containing protein n=1 Tax=Confluentibacter sediminis TaxID=2219045 RepID=UPI000DAC2A53|nr:phospholipase D-like domain-containing protein [Confluentibacter sediminis]